MYQSDNELKEPRQFPEPGKWFKMKQDIQKVYRNASIRNIHLNGKFSNIPLKDCIVRVECVTPIIDRDFVYIDLGVWFGSNYLEEIIIRQDKMLLPIEIFEPFDDEEMIAIFTLQRI